jgi:nucleoside-diphosphate-sugar epimerase
MAVMARIEKSYQGRTVLVTGGASFIGSHLVDRLLDAGADVHIIDDFSSGRRENVPTLPEDRIVEIDLANRELTLARFPECEYVFHLAAVHGGRGFIDTFPDQVLVNLAIDNNVYTAAAAAGSRHVIHASSACVYPTTLQADASSRHLLAESEAGFLVPGQAFADGAYGWAKLMGEYQAWQFALQSRFRASSARLFTAYGERENESHAAIALIAKALLRVDPYPIWGDGMQTRNFTYVSDTVRGLLLLGSRDEEADDEPFRAVNIGSSQHHTVKEFIETVFSDLGWTPNELELQTWRPVGVASRASDNAIMRSLFGWEPETPLAEGIQRTLAWYAGREDRPTTADQLEELLLAR